MKKNTSKIILIILLVFASLLSACNGSDANSGDIPAPVTDENSITDANGLVWVVPENPNQTTLAAVYAVAVPFIVALNLDERVTAINSKSAFWTDNVAGFRDVGTVGKGSVDLEALAKDGADALIYRAGDLKTVEAVSELGIAAICISAEDMDGIFSTLDIMGKYFGASARAAEVKSYMQAKFDMIDEITKNIPEEERATALVLGGETGTVAGVDMLQAWMVEKAGGIYATDDLKNDGRWVDAGVERIFAANPDFIFCTASTVLDYSAETLKNDRAWRDLTAAQNERILTIPAKIDAWDMPGVAPVIGTLWMLHEMYPECFSAERLQAEVDEYYMLMFGRKFDSAYLGYTLE
jgi:ABC-type Fe3+-hydroxamate transport system substrate-binding protein